MKPQFVHAINATTSDVCEIAHSLREEAKKTWLCPGCASPRVNRGIPILTLKSKIRELALNSIPAVGLGVIREDLLELLKKHYALDDLALSGLTDPNGEKIGRFHVFRTKNEILVRGSPQSKHRKCGVCSRQLYHPIGKEYVLKSDWSDDKLFGEQFKGFIVRLNVAEEIREMKLKGVVITKLPLFDVPMDNL